MATRSMIAYDKQGKFEAIYCHWDGYPSHQLPILKEKYSTARKVTSLLNKGDLSSLETDTDWKLDKMPEARPLTYKERGDTDVEAKVYSSIDELKQAAKDCWAEYLYIYMNRYGWKYVEV